MRFETDADLLAAEPALKQFERVIAMVLNAKQVQQYICSVVQSVHRKQR